MEAATVKINGEKHVLVKSRRRMYNFTQAYKVRGVNLIGHPESRYALVSTDDLKRLTNMVDREHWSLSVDTYEATKIINDVVKNPL